MISKRPGEQYFENHITASGFEEQLTCSKALMACHRMA